MLNLIKRFKRTEEALLQAKEALSIAAQQPVLLSINRSGRKIIFKFVRNGELTIIETMGTWDDDIETWRKALLGDR